jgi:uncharacterized membrane protein (DUF2068 family)
VETRPKKRDKWLLLIGIVKVVKAALLLMTAIGVLDLLSHDWSAVVEKWIERINMDADNALSRKLVSQLATLTPHKLSLLCTGAFVYSAMFLTEGIGLLLQKRWGEYVTVFITGSFLPFEIYELVAKNFNAFKLLLLLGNIAVVIYLVWRLIHYRKRRPVTPRSTSAPGPRSSPSPASEK